MMDRRAGVRRSGQAGPGLARLLEAQDVHPGWIGLVVAGELGTALAQQAPAGGPAVLLAGLGVAGAVFQRVEPEGAPGLPEQLHQARVATAGMDRQPRRDVVGPA